MTSLACRLHSVHTEFEQTTHRDDGSGQPGSALVWRFDRTTRAVSSGVLGGGLRSCAWVVNAQVSLAYQRHDPERHLCEIAAELGLAAESGIGLLTAAEVSDVTSARESDVRCDATVGLSYPVWAAAPQDEPFPDVRWRPGTINLVCLLPVRLSDAALVNAVMTVTEAKTQALLNVGVPGSGTASDAVVICCPDDGEAEPFGGPRSTWGARLARVVHACVIEGAARYGRRPDRSDGAERSLARADPEHGERAMGGAAGSIRAQEWEAGVEVTGNRVRP